jgi:Flp pilus assembly protein TadG
LTTRRTKKDAGQALVEFAIILPILLLLLFGILQFGVIFNNYVQVTSAAREGARKAAVSRTLGTAGATSAARTAAKNASPGLRLSDSQITVTPSNNFAQGSDVTVTVRYPYSINILGRIVASGNLSSSTTTRVE